MAAPGAHAYAERAAGQLEALLADWQTRYPDVQAGYDFVLGHPGRALVGLSARADLVVLGRHRPDGFVPGPGAVRHAVLNHAHRPVVTVPYAAAPGQGKIKDFKIPISNGPRVPRPAGPPRSSAPTWSARCQRYR